MTNTYKTLNPLGSTSPKDLYDNASNFDEGMNSASPSFYDRFMLRRETWSGMETRFDGNIASFQSQFYSVLQALGYEAVHLTYVPGSPLVVDRQTQLIDYLGSSYHVKTPATFPVTLTGTWATDSALLLDVGDAALRSDLANISNPALGAAMVSRASQAVTSFTQMRALSKTVPSAYVELYGDSFISFYRRDDADTSSAESLPFILVATDGARYKLNHNGIVTAAQCGLVGDGVTINTSATLNARIVAVRDSGCRLYWGAGTWLCQPMTVIEKMNWLGAGRKKTIIKSAPGINATLLSIPAIGVVRNASETEFEDITFDGNRDNNTTGGLLKLRGASPRIRRCDFVNSADISVHTDWDQTDPATYSRLGGVEGIFEDIIVDKSGASGWVYDGPTDSSFVNVTLKDCGLKATLTHFGIVINSSARFYNLHPWNSGDLTVVPIASVSLGGFGGCNFVNCHFEGSQCPLKIEVGSNGNTFEGCQWYGTRGPYALEVYSTGNKIGGVIGGLAYAGNPNYKGMLLQGVGNDINLIDGGGATICAVEFAAGESSNKVSLIGYRTAGQPVLGSISSTDEVFINVSGGAGGAFAQHVKLAPSSTVRGVTSAGGTPGSASATVDILYDGKFIDWHCSLGITTLGAAGGDWQISMPFTATRFYSVMGFENLSGNAVRMTMAAGSSTLRIVSLTNAFVGASGMTIAGGGRCEFN